MSFGGTRMRMDKAAEHIRRAHKLLDELRMQVEEQVLLATQRLEDQSARRIARELNLSVELVEDILDQYIG